jgi:hypothetical protein
MLMSNGRIMYSGLGREVGEWFANLDCKLPYGWNIADYILDLANGEFQDNTRVLGVSGKERKMKLIEVREHAMFQIHSLLRASKLACITHGGFCHNRLRESWLRHNGRHLRRNLQARCKRVMWLSFARRIHRWGTSYDRFCGIVSSSDELGRRDKIGCVQSALS